MSKSRRTSDLVNSLLVNADNSVNIHEGTQSPYFQLDTAATPTLQPGMFGWNDADGTANLRLKGNNVTLQLGQETLVRVVNKTGADLLESQYKAVRIRLASEGGAAGQRLAVVLAKGDADLDSVTTLGIVTETIPNNQEGFVTVFGNVNEINTTGSLQGETWVDGDVLYLSPTTAGSLTKVKPTAPNHTVTMGYVVYAHAVHGKIFVKVDNGYELEELHDVAPTPYINKGVLYRDTATNLWKSATIATLLGYTPADDSVTVKTTGSYSNPSWLTSLAWGKISGTPTTLSGYGITDAVPTTRTLTINGVAQDLSADRSWTISFATPTLAQVTTAGNTTTNAITVGGLTVDTSLIATDTTNKRVSISAPIGSIYAKLFVESDSSTTDKTDYTLVLNNKNTSTVTNTTTGIYFANSGGPGTSQPYNTSHIIAAVVSTATNWNNVTSRGYLSFLLNDSSNVRQEYLRIFNTGNVSIQTGGTYTDAGYKLDVNGTARVTGTLTVGQIITANGTSDLIMQTHVAAGSVLTVRYNSSQNATGANKTVLTIDTTFNPTSGISQFTGLTILPTINQTGTASGVTRGIYINPTLTAAADFRAIETTVGKVIFGSTSGNVLIGTTTDAGQKLQVLGNSRFFSAVDTYHTIESTATGSAGTIYKNTYRQYFTGTNYATANSWEVYDLTAGAPVIHVSGPSRAVGINKVNASYQLDVEGAFRTTQGAYLATSSGFVGIGTTSPAYLLDVNGTINALSGYAINGTAGWTGTISNPLGPVGQQNIQVQGGIIVNVY